MLWLNLRSIGNTHAHTTAVILKDTGTESAGYRDRLEGLSRILGLTPMAVGDDWRDSQRHWG
jgi:hypothetical protein